MGATITWVREHWGPITTVVACAGIETLGDVTGVSSAEWRRTFDVNVTGVYLTARHTIAWLV